MPPAFGEDDARLRGGRGQRRPGEFHSARDIPAPRTARDRVDDEGDHCRGSIRNSECGIWNAYVNRAFRILNSKFPIIGSYFCSVSVTVLPSTAPSSTPSASIRMTRYCAVIESPSLARKRSPEPEMIAVRTA